MSPVYDDIMLELLGTIGNDTQEKQGTNTFNQIVRSILKSPEIPIEIPRNSNRNKPFI